MRIKKIEKSDDLIQVDFGLLKDSWEGRKVLTPSGWEEIRNFSFIKSGKCKIVSTAAGTIKCDPGHCFLIDRNNVKSVARADQLDIETDRVYSIGDKLLDFIVDDGAEEDFYDITIDDPHWWYTSGMISHNSIVLCNNAITSWQGPGSGGRIGQDVLLVTFELSYIKTAMRCLGVLGENIPMDKLITKQEEISSKIDFMKTTYDGKIFISELPPEECSVDHLYHLIDNLRRAHGWHPDVIVLDYLDLMVSRNKFANRDDYSRQKAVAGEIRGLAKNENVLIFTATQTNRNAGTDGKEIGLKDTAESYAKQFSMDYIVSINQTTEERESSPARFRFIISKNRNGPKGKTITCEVNYNTMKVKEINT